MKLPQIVRKLGWEHRRKAGYKYVQLPELQEKLTTTRKAWLLYLQWHKQYGSCATVSVQLEQALREQFHCAWVTYYGEDAEKELQTMYHTDVFQAEDWRRAIIIMDYDAPKIDTYRATNIMIDDHVHSFSSGKPVKDYNDALRFAQGEGVDEIVQHDSCQMFVLHSRARYWFNLAEQMVEVERE